VAAVFTAGAVTASNDRSSLTGQLFSYLGFNAGSQTERGDMSSVAPQVKGDPAAKGDIQPSSCDNAPAGLIACYRGDATTTDTTGVHDGAWVGEFGYAAGKAGSGAFSFNGQSRVEVPNAADLNPANLTVAGWVNLSTADATFALISKGDEYALEVQNGRVVFVSRNAAGELETLESRSIPTATWVHIAATHDGTTRQIYINGESVASGRQEGLFTGDEGPLSIGSTITKHAAFTALADEVQLFGRALSGDEIKNIGKPEDFNTVNVTPNPVPEGNGFTTVTVNRNGAVANGVSYIFTPIGGNATSGASCAAGVDYVLSTNSVTYAPCESGNKSFVIQICQDTIAEGTETGQIQISSAPPGEAFLPFNFTFDISF